MGKIELIDIEDRIFTIRGIQVMFDNHLAEMYQVETKALNRAVKRNIERFPESFRFKLTVKEFENLRCQTGTIKNQGADLRYQTGTSSGEHGGRRYLPYVF